MPEGHAISTAPVAAGAPTPRGGQGRIYRFDAARPERLRLAVTDVVDGFTSWRLASALARLDLKNRYRGSVLGPLWVTLSTAAMLLGIGLLYGQLLGIALGEYLPYLAVSLVAWGVISGTVLDSCGAMIQAEGIVRQLRVPHSVHALRCAVRNAIVALHNLPLILLVFLVFGHWPGAEAIMVIPGLVLLGINAVASCFLLGMVCARFRDIGQIVASVMQLAFFMTPVIWKPDQLRVGHVFLLLNPFYPLLEVVRGPLIEGGASAGMWAAAVLVTLVHAGVAFAFFVRFRGRLAFWV
ncbi:ABC transporter permease [Roseomonas sp. CCTCC AB2023176]|uniref:ABC transporter permease n=1 Tax=Roseomonas sp. CCTCC AB2023176 TaxID=3342640 RepID=UPI0035D6A6F1